VGGTTRGGGAGGAAARRPASLGRVRCARGGVGTDSSHLLVSCAVVFFVFALARVHRTAHPTGCPVSPWAPPSPFPSLVCGCTDAYMRTVAALHLRPTMVFNPDVGSLGAKKHPTIALSPPRAPAADGDAQAAAPAVAAAPAT